jgi:hypothetical protein
MKKMSTLFKKDSSNNVTNVLASENAWALMEGIPTRKFDGTSCAIIDGELYKRFDLKEGRTLPPNSVPCQEADKVTGHHPHWTKCERDDNSNKWHFVAFDVLENKADGTYELCGEKIQRNPENIEGHKLIPHGSEVLDIVDFSYEGLREYLTENNVEGIVFHNRNDSRMCKIRKCDFGFKR